MVGTVGTVVGTAVGTLVNYNRNCEIPYGGFYLDTLNPRFNSSYCNLQQLLQRFLQRFLQFLLWFLQQIASPRPLCLLSLRRGERPA